ncbi:hypothetical protein SAMN04488137_1005 [Fictibacillus solisalsi]|uniref:Uncharacterized protein n=1 Tax=Fictibacillus solisalsi TaxID=459525 RepID=A0A1G9UM30_9BACL|nr:hypothetical protein [Fictibacillus solisalsi]SDM60894.1 hypothetical protein SAMN04488137_1005 [Fictibacillus solisalsi]
MLLGLFVEMEHMYFHSPIKMWKKGNRIVIVVELLEAVLSVTPESHPRQFAKLQRILDGEEVLPFITYTITIEETD